MRMMARQKVIMLCMIYILLGLSLAHIGPSTESHGVSSGQNTNMYIDLNSGSGFQFQNFKMEQVDDSQQFTLLLWFKLNQFPWDREEDGTYHGDMILIQAKDRFQCKITRQKRLDCASGKSSSGRTYFNMDVNDDVKFKRDQWQLLVLNSEKGRSQLSLYDQSFKRDERARVNGPWVYKISSSFRPFEESKYEELYIGIDNNKYDDGLIGSVRQVQMIGKNLDTTQKVMNAAFVYLLEEAEHTLLFQATLFNLTSGLDDSVSGSRAQIIGQKITPEIDFNSQFFCWSLNPLQYLEYMKIADLKFQNYEMSSKIYKNTGNKGDYKVTFYGWIFRDPDYGPFKNEETLFEHEKVQKLTFERNTYDQLTVTHLGYSQYPFRVQFPRGEWIWVVSWHDYNGFGIHVEDSHGKIYNDGNQKELHHLAETSFMTDKTIKFGEDFQGYVRGIKYYRGNPTNFEKVDMINEIDNSANAIWYFRFDEYGFLNQYKNSFANKIKYRSTSSQFALRVQTGKPNYRHILAKNLTDIYDHSSIDYETTWDGISCKEEQKFIYLENEYEWARTEFQFLTIKEFSNSQQRQVVDVGKEHKDLTVELWFKPTAGESRRRQNLLTLMKNEDPILVIQKDSSGELTCLPLYEKYYGSKAYGVQYHDYKEQNAWHHISCSITFSGEPVIQGTLYVQDSSGNFQDYGYINRLSPKVAEEFSLEQRRNSDKFQLQINDDKYGLKKVFFADVRLWSTSRTWNEIKANRFHLLDYKKQNDRLLSAFQLLGGGHMNSTEYDIGQIDFQMLTYQNQINDEYTVFGDQNQIKFFRQPQWLVDNKLILCPLQTFYNPDEKECIRDGILKLNTFIQKDTINQKYIVTPQFSEFANENLRNNYMSEYRFEWTLVRMTQLSNYYNKAVFPNYFDKQQNNHKLEFSFDEVSEFGTYKLKLSLKDPKSNQQEVSQDISMMTAECLQFHDKDTKKVFSNVNFTKEKGKETINLQFETIIAENCSQYSNRKVSYSYSFINPGTKASNNNGLIFSSAQQKLSISAKAQRYMPLNQDILIQIKAKWSNQLELSIVYNLRFDTQVNLVLDSSREIVPLGAVVSLYTNESSIVNYKGSDDDLSFTVQFLCQQGQEELCKRQNQRENKMNIVFEEFKDLKKYEYWVSYTFIAKSSSNFLQGDGSIHSYAQKNITWIPFDPQAEIQGSSYISVDQILKQQMTTNGINRDQIRFEWRINPKVDEKYFIDSNDDSLFMIEPDVLKKNTYYTIFVKIILKSTNQAFWDGSRKIQINPAPKNGRVSISPFQGQAFETKFLLTARDWIVRNDPAVYQFMYEDANGQFSPLTAYISKSFVKTYLPPCSRVMVKLKDRKNIMNKAISTAYSRFNDETATIETQEKLFQKAVEDSSLTRRLTSFSLLSNNFMKFSSFQGYYLSKVQASRLVNYLEQEVLPLSLASRLSPTENIHFAQSAISIFGIITYRENLFNHNSAIQMQNTVLALLNNAEIEPEIKELFQTDQEIRSSILKFQSNILLALQIQAQKGLLKYKFTDPKILTITEKVRQIVSTMEKYIGIGMVAGDKIDFKSEMIDLNMQKFVRLSKLEDLSTGYNESDRKNYKVNVTMDQVDQPTEIQTLSQITFKNNPFLGSNYKLNPEDKIQQVRSNYTLYVSWRDELGVSLQNPSVEYTFPYNYDRYAYNKSMELQLTHCSYIDEDNIFGKCETQFFFDENKISCKCDNKKSFLTITRDEFIQPLITTQDSFDFQNWSSFIIFSYLMLLYIFGMILSSNMDQKDMAKMNDMNTDEKGQISLTIRTLQFPLTAYALKRQVYLMNFVSGDITQSRFIGICLSQFHPILTLIFRYDANLSRQDRFMLLFTQISIITLISFLLLRNADRPLEYVPPVIDDGRSGLVIDEQNDLYAPDQFEFNLTNLKLPLILTFSMSVLLLPIPSCIRRCLYHRYTLNDLDEEEQKSDMGNDDFMMNNPDFGSQFFEDSFELDAADIAPTDINKTADEKKKQMMEYILLHVDPNLPLKPLFQLSAFKITYLKSSLGSERFTFLLPNGDVGEWLDMEEENIANQKNKDLKLKEEETTTRRQGNRATLKKKKKKSNRPRENRTEERKQIRESMQSRQSDSFIGKNPDRPMHDVQEVSRKATQPRSSIQYDDDEEPRQDEDVDDDDGNVIVTDRPKFPKHDPSSSKANMKSLALYGQRSNRQSMGESTTLNAKRGNIESSPAPSDNSIIQDTSHRNLFGSNANHNSSQVPDQNIETGHFDNVSLFELRSIKTNATGRFGQMSVKSNNLSDSSRRHTYLKNKLRARAAAIDNSDSKQFEGGESDNVVAIDNSDSKQYEGGDSDDEDDDRNIMSGVPKEFILDTQCTQSKKQNCMRCFIYLLNIAIYGFLMTVYILEEMHNRGGHYVWIVVSLTAQLIGFFVTTVIYHVLVAFYTMKYRKSKPFLSSYFYEYLVLLEDYDHVQKFQSQRIN